LLPKVDDSNNRKIVNHIMNRANEVDEIDQPEVVDVLDVVEVVDVVDVVDVVESEPRIERFAVVGFGLGSGVSNSTKRLVNLDTRLKDCGNLNGAKPQLRFRSQWQGKEFAGTSLVLLASLTSVPTVSFGEFLSDLVASAKGRAPGAQPAIQVILTDGKETRERLEYDQDKFETRVNQWIGRIVESGVDKESVLTFDVSTDTGVSSAWNELKPDSAAFEFEGLQFAGETKQAIKIVRRQFADALSAGTRSSDDDWLKHLTLISNELGKLYEKERLSFLKYLDGKKCADTVKAAIDSAELPSGMLPEEFQAMAKAMALFKTLSPKWIGAGALGGLALGVASGIAIIATGGALALPILIPTVITPTFGGAVTAQFLKTHWFSKLPQDKSLETRPATADALSDAAIHALKASILQIIVLELQGNPEGKITQQLREQTQRLDHHPLRNMNDIETMLDDFQMGMSKIGGQS
jgi:hypothetical protein